MENKRKRVNMRRTPPGRGDWNTQRSERSKMRSKIRKFDNDSTDGK